MNKAVFLFLLLMFMIDYSQSQNSIIEDLQTNVDSSEGVIRIKANPAIIALTDTSNSRSKFRVQVFMSNDPCKARLEAISKQALIKNILPGIPTCLIYESPNWKLLIGDFANKEEANAFKERAQKEFPKLGKEMCVIAER